MVHRQRVLGSIRGNVFVVIVGSVLAGTAHDVRAQPQQQFADLGDCELESGEVIRDCQVGYLTFGRLNADRSNAILFQTGLWNRALDAANFLGPDGLFDPADWFIISVDAFGNGISSSPSNSLTQAGESFPRFTIRDMVNSQYRLVTEVLGIDTLHAVSGISMGGFQTFEWMVSYPSMMRKAIPMVGSPRLTSFDLLLWGTVLDVIEQCYRAGCENPGSLALKIAYLGIVTPQQRISETPREGMDVFVSELEEQALSIPVPADAMSQIRAALTNDISRSFGGSIEEAAQAVQSEALIVVNTLDTNVRPEPALDFARRISAELYESDGPFGHRTPRGEMEAIGRRIASFLSQ